MNRSRDIAESRHEEGAQTGGTSQDDRLATRSRSDAAPAPSGIASPGSRSCPCEDQAPLEHVDPDLEWEVLRASFRPSASLSRRQLAAQGELRRMFAEARLVDWEALSAFLGDRETCTDPHQRRHLDSIEERLQLAWQARLRSQLAKRQASRERVFVAALAAVSVGVIVTAWFVPDHLRARAGADSFWGLAQAGTTGASLLLAVVSTFGGSPLRQLPSGWLVAGAGLRLVAWIALAAVLCLPSAAALARWAGASRVWLECDQPAVRVTANGVPLPCDAHVNVDLARDDIKVVPLTPTDRTMMCWVEQPRSAPQCTPEGSLPIPMQEVQRGLWLLAGSYGAPPLVCEYAPNSRLAANIQACDLTARPGEATPIAARRLQIRRVGPPFPARTLELYALQTRPGSSGLTADAPFKQEPHVRSNPAELKWTSTGDFEIATVVLHACGAKDANVEDPERDLDAALQQLRYRSAPDALMEKLECRPTE